MAKSTAQKEAELREAGWSPSAGDSVEAAWARTATASDRAADAGTPTPTPAPVVQPVPQQKDFSADLAKIQAGFAASSGLSIKQLEEQKRQFDLTLDWQKKMWEQQGLPQLAIQQRAQDLEEKKFGELTGQAHRQQDFVEEIGRRQAALAEKSQADANAIAQGQLGLGQSQLGLDTLKTAASLSGPADWIKAANFTRGVAGDSQLPGFMQQLLSGGNTAVLGGPAPGAQQSDPLTLGGLAARMGTNDQLAAQKRAMLPAGQQPVSGDMHILGEQPAGLYDQRAADQLRAQKRAMLPAGQPPVTGDMHYLTEQPGATTQQYAQPSQNDAVDTAAQTLRRVYAAGGGALGPQALEGLTPSEMSMFTGGGESIGSDVPGFIESYKRSRIGQGASAFKF